MKQMDKQIGECRAANLADLNALIATLRWVVLEDHKIYNIQTNLLNSISECIKTEQCFQNMAIHAMVYRTVLE